MNEEMNLFHWSVFKVGYAYDVFKIFVPIHIQVDIGIVFCGLNALDTVEGEVPNLVGMVLLHSEDEPPNYYIVSGNVGEICSPKARLRKACSCFSAPSHIGWR